MEETLAMIDTARNPPQRASPDALPPSTLSRAASSHGSPLSFTAVPSDELDDPRLRERTLGVHDADDAVRVHIPSLFQHSRISGR